MEDDPGIQQRKEDLKRSLQKLGDLLGETGSTLDAVTSGSSPDDGLRRLERLQGELAASVKDYLEQNAGFSAYIQERVRKIEEANRKASMSEPRSKAPRDEARLQQLSDELTRDLRLERIDSALKELLDFLSDAEFFAANATTGRRRRLRALQNAIDKALQK